MHISIERKTITEPSLFVVERVMVDGIALTSYILPRDEGRAQAMVYALTALATFDLMDAVVSFLGDEGERLGYLWTWELEKLVAASALQLEEVNIINPIPEVPTACYVVLPDHVTSEIVNTVINLLRMANDGDTLIEQLEDIKRNFPA